MKKIGIDTSTTNTAVVMLNDDNELLHFELLSPSSKNIVERSTEICKSVDIFFNGVSREDCIVGIEGASFMSAGKRDKLVMLMGYIHYSLQIRGYNVTLLPPSTIKKQFTGNGRAKKEEMIEALPYGVKENFLKASKKIDDLADAYAIASILV